MASQFRVRFTRYDKARCQRSLGRSTFLHAEDFHDAMRIADAILQGMRAADPANEYEIMAVTSDGYRGTDYDLSENSGIGMFTSFAETVGAEAAARAAT